MKTQVQILLPSTDLTQDLNFFIELGFRLDHIFPSDNPAVAILSGYEIQLRIDKNVSCPPPIIQLLTDDLEKKELIAPNGTIIQIHSIISTELHKINIPTTQHKFEVRKLQDNDPWVIGRAGMLYRDLIPDRLGGGIIASHIRIPTGGPVPDMVHYHTLGFQLIFCYKGWVKLVYEDQGEAFILRAGDCVTQPPEIRHRVLESSDNLEVIEIGVPAEHMTTIDHQMQLPTNKVLPNREFNGQLFCHHKVTEAIWSPWRINGFEYRDTGIVNATKGIASVHVARAIKTNEKPQLSSHNTDILFTFVLEGNLDLKADGYELKKLQSGDAFVIPPHLPYQITSYSDNLQILEISLPGKFNTLNA